MKFSAMGKTILSDNQTKILDAICQDKQICRHFYLTGGTALSEFYLHHRLSEDLDFFSENEFNTQAINVFFAKNKTNLGFKKIDFQQSFNRNLFFVDFGKDSVKTEFTFFPFPRIEEKIGIGDLYIDSVLDIAVNKLFTIYQKPRSRDFIDLYLINQKYNYGINDLIKKAKIKFDFHIDYLQLGTQFARATELKDYPTMKITLDKAEWQDYFLSEAKNFKGKILS